MTLSFSLTNEGRSIQVHCDDEGLDALIAALQRLRNEGDHIHLRSLGGGGSLLSDRTPWGDPAIGEVIVTTGGD